LKNIFIAILGCLVIFLGTYNFRLRKQIIEAKDNIDQHSKILDSLQQDKINKLVQDKFDAAVAQFNYAKAKKDFDDTSKKKN